jgi:hypothetical protein
VCRGEATLADLRQDILIGQVGSKPEVELGREIVNLAVQKFRYCQQWLQTLDKIMSCINGEVYAADNKVSWTRLSESKARVSDY